MASSLAEFTNDKLFSGQYTSFEMKSGESGLKTEAVGSASKPIPLAQFVQQPLKKYGGGEDLDRKVPTVYKEIAIDASQIVQFYGRNHWLSNFAQSPVHIHGYTYPTVEHYYEACKIYGILGPNYAAWLRNCKDPGQAKIMAKQILQNVPKKNVEGWKRRDGFTVIRLALMEKFRQHPSLQRQLLETGDKLLVQCNKYDKLWAANMNGREFDEWVKENTGKTLKYPAVFGSEPASKYSNVGSGKNLLGFALMYTRECLRSELGLPAFLKDLSLDSKKATEGDAAANSTDSSKSEDSRAKSETPNADGAVESDTNGAKENKSGDAKQKTNTTPKK